MIKGEKIYLRALEPTDVDLLYKWENDTTIWRVSNTLTPFSKQILQEYVLSATNDIYVHKQLRLLICKNDATPIGCIDLFDFDPFHLRAGIGILIAENDERKKGYGENALSTLINYCFNTLLLRQVYCNITTENVDSLKLFQKSGFEICGIKKSWIKANSGWIDEYTLQLINHLH